MSIGHRRFRAAIFHYVDIGTDGRSDNRWVKQVSDESDGNWWVQREVMNASDVIRGGKPEYRLGTRLHFARGAPIESPDGKPESLAFLMADTLQIFVAASPTYRRDIGQFEVEVLCQLYQDQFLTATYSDGYYYAD